MHCKAVATKADKTSSNSNGVRALWARDATRTRCICRRSSRTRPCSTKAAADGRRWWSLSSTLPAAANRRGGSGCWGDAVGIEEVRQLLVTFRDLNTGLPFRMLRRERCGFLPPSCRTLAVDLGRSQLTGISHPLRPGCDLGGSPSKPSALLTVHFRPPLWSNRRRPARASLESRRLPTHGRSCNGYGDK